MVVASSGFTRAGVSKVVGALASRATLEPFEMTLLTGASLSQGTVGTLAQGSTGGTEGTLSDRPIHAYDICGQYS
ncbi:hypothetical protein [Salmonirosea aquatica]|uniref:Uncharacterized protein n=1 Tax=Salmonirosea aquatica TaxID=2654236 RepID=A0A7C9F4B2_9BACT|nr:hypothetical protein [Cytophagaceae bacterium SJW1-29]